MAYYSINTRSIVHIGIKYHPIQFIARTPYMSCARMRVKRNFCLCHLCTVFTIVVGARIDQTTDIRLLRHI